MVPGGREDLPFAVDTCLHLISACRTARCRPSGRWCGTLGVPPVEKRDPRMRVCNVCLHSGRAACRLPVAPWPLMRVAAVQSQRRLLGPTDNKSGTANTQGSSLFATRCLQRAQYVTVARERRSVRHPQSPRRVFQPQPPSSLSGVYHFLLHFPFVTDLLARCSGMQTGPRLPRGPRRITNHHNTVRKCVCSVVRGSAAMREGQPAVTGASHTTAANGNRQCNQRPPTHS
jgi:hypothetical protein